VTTRCGAGPFYKWRVFGGFSAEPREDQVAPARGPRTVIRELVRGKSRQEMAQLSKKRH